MEIIVSYDVSKMTDEQIEEMGIDKTTMSYDEMKKDAVEIKVGIKNHLNN